MNRILTILSLFLMLSSIGYGQDKAQQANLKLKGMFVYNFIKNVDWPSGAVNGSYKIGVFGDKSLYTQLNSSYAGKEINGQKLTFEYFEKLENKDDLQLVYIAPKLSSSLAGHRSSFEKNKTLVVTEKEGLLKNGSVINFVILNNKLNFEVSKSNAEVIPLTIGPALLKMATSVI